MILSAWVQEGAQCAHTFWITQLNCENQIFLIFWKFIMKSQEILDLQTHFFMEK